MQGGGGDFFFSWSKRKKKPHKVILYSKNRINVPHSRRMPVIKTKSIVDITGESSGWVHVEGVCVFANATAERLGEITAFE